MISDTLKTLYPDCNILHYSCLNAQEDGLHGEKIFAQLMTISGLDGVADLRIVEIGTHYGAATMFLAQYGHVDTFDIEDHTERSKVFEALNGDGRATFHLVKNTGEIEEWCAANPFDLAFIDGNHGYDAVVRDFNMVKKCGHVIFHDYKHNAAHTGNTVRFVDAIQDGRVTRQPSFAMWESPARIGMTP